MGLDIGTSITPAMTGLVPLTVGFDKGCYTGQELVARIDSRGGNVPRRLRVVEVAGAVPAMGAVVHGEGEDSGTLTSVAETPEGAVGLALVHRRVEAPADVTVRWDGAEAPARVHSVPGAG